MHVLRLHCCDKPGIVAAVATSLANHQCNIEESAQFHDPLSEQFFMRVVFEPLESGCLEKFQTHFTKIAETYAMQWAIYDLTTPIKTLIMVSKEDHCLNDLLYRTRRKAFPIEITGIVSNHETTRTLVEDRGFTFHHLPINKNNKAAQEKALCKIMKDTNTELLILARYMQVLSPEMAQRYDGRIINIHHSFLPGFKGAKPYHQAYERGVKIIGATAHFATSDLDEGPIITQETTSVDHSYTPTKMQTLGRDTESRTLARAITLYTERRVFLHGGRTVIL